MNKTETQQFSKFFLKDLKTKKPDHTQRKTYLEKSNFSSPT